MIMLYEVMSWLLCQPRERLCYCCHASQDRMNASAVPTGEGSGTPLQSSCLEHRMDGGARWAAVQGVVKSQTLLSDFTFTFHFHALEKEMATHSSVLAWRIPGRGSLVGCCLWGRTESGTTEVTQQQQQFLRLLVSSSSLLACTLPTPGSVNRVNCVNSETTGIMNRINNTNAVCRLGFPWWLRW